MIRPIWVMLGLMALVLNGCHSSGNRTTFFHSPLHSMDDLTIQLAVDASHPLHLPARSAVVEVDLFDTPAGDRSRIRQHSKLQCYFSAGTFENWRPDAADYPASIIGHADAGWTGEYWVDIRSDVLKAILGRRLDLAVQKGCDGVDPDNVDGYRNNTGFALTAADQLAFNRWLAQAAHQRGLYVVLKNDPSQASQLVDDFDAVVSESCYRFNECALFDVFLQRNKPVWDIEYSGGTFNPVNGDAFNTFCTASNQAGRHGYWVPTNLDGSFRHSCQADTQMWNDMSFGFGDASSFHFLRAGGGDVWLPTQAVVLDANLSARSDVLQIRNVRPAGFARLHQLASRADFISLWVTQGWQTSWFDTAGLSALVQAGKGLVFNYWYFGDQMMNGFPNAAAQQAYLNDVQRLGRFLATLPGHKWVNLEPEFNKDILINSTTNQQAFIALMRQAIAQLKAVDPSIYVSLTMMDRGRRSSAQTLISCGYANCALGDQALWAETSSIYTALADKLDYLSFQEMVAQFHRDWQNPGTWRQPNPFAESTVSSGIDQLAQRIANFATWLHTTYGKPVMLPYFTVPTATWQDGNGNGRIDAGEINPTGWEAKLTQLTDQLHTGAIYQQLRDAHMIGIAAMMLFDNPQHDAGGYRAFLLNEDYMGLVATGAVPDVDLAADGALRFKGANGKQAIDRLLARP